MRRAQWWAVFAIGAFAVVGCSGDSDGGAVATEPPVTICSATGAPQAEADLPAVSSVRTAISDLEQELGGPQEFFEVNATARLVNLFVALNGGTLAQAWVWVDGELSSVEPQAASGGTFTGADWKSTTHIDVVATRFNIWVDDRQIMADGKFLL